MIVLDTHALVWWTQEPLLLSRDAAQAIDHADRILVPAICFWETSLLVRKGRLALKRGQPVAEWAAEVLAIPRILAVPLSAELALAADALSMHPDPADRFIVATALAGAYPLITKDDLLQRIGWLDTLW
jgi:PIN domain nuclease of toxin-antitoxin system